MSFAVISPGTGHDQRRLDLGGVGVHAADDALEVQDDVGDVLLDARDRRELVRDALDAHARDGGAGERGQQHAAQRVAERVAEAAVERLDREACRGSPRRSRLVIRGTWKSSIEGPNVVLLIVAGVGRTSASSARAWRPASRSRCYFEYSSTMSCSCTGAAISRRSGLRSTFAVSDVVVGLQPRRNLSGQLGRVADHLRRGGCRP